MSPDLQHPPVLSTSITTSVVNHLNHCTLYTTGSTVQ